jgi:F0F1-type ATP synthase assembly protein I
MKKSLFFALSFFTKVGVTTAFPAVALGLTGRYLDKIYGTSPYLTIAGFIVAFGLTIIILRKLAKEAIAINKDQ